MGKVYSIFTRPLRVFNIANRAEKIISREKPIPAPHHASIEKQKKLVDQVYPNFLEDHYRKDTQLDQRLKDVFVTSIDAPEKMAVKETKLLPQDRHTTNNPVFDLYEPIVIPVGKCSLKQTFTFLSQHKQNPIIYNSEKLAAEYKIDKKVMDDILKHFKLYVSLEASSSDDVKDRDFFQDVIDERAKKIGEHDRK